MDSCLAVEKELDRVIKKFTAINEHSGRVIEDVIHHIIEFQTALAERPEDAELTQSQRDYLKDELGRDKEKLQKLTSDHRDLHGTVSKVGKAIDRNFESDFTATTRHNVFASEMNTQLLNTIIAQHFYRQGMDDVANKLIKESNLETDEITREPYAELHRIWECINNHDLSPALVWAMEHSDKLNQKNSTLEFKLHRLAFIQILDGEDHQQNSQTESKAIAYARTYFPKFVDRFQKDIQSLMGTLIYLPNGIQNSPYRHLLAAEMWIETADTFLKDACHVLGINKDSPLSVVVNAGCRALPALLNLKQVMLSRQVMGIWTGRDELPIEIDLEPENRYHSIFACPILRQQSSDSNPPMKLICGHVISRDALNKLSTGSTLKCPYCPIEQSPADARLISF